MNNVTTYYKDQIKERKEKYLKNFTNSEYKDIIEKAYDALLEQSIIFRLALKKTSDKILMHTIGEKDPTKTLLTPDEYIRNLNRQRNRL